MSCGPVLSTGAVFRPVTVMSNGREIQHEALVDNQASANIMGREFADYNGIKYQGMSNTIILADGKQVKSIGSANVTVRFKRNPPEECEFEVLERAIAPLILGRPSLYKVGILRAPPERPPDETQQHQSKLAIQLRMANQMTVAHAAPMTSAPVGAMSLTYADANWYHINTTNQRINVIGGDGEPISIERIVKIKVQLNGIPQIGRAHV